MACFRGAKGWILPHLNQLKGSISEAAFSFMVQEPKEIMDWFNAKSLRSKDFMYRINSVSEWYVLKTVSVKNSERRCKDSIILLEDSTSEIIIVSFLAASAKTEIK